MSLEHTDLQHLNAAQGFATLGMYEDANAELEEIDAFCRASPEVLEVRVEIYCGAKKWDMMQVVATKLAQHNPSEARWCVSRAYATRRCESIPAAKAILLDAVTRFGDEAIIYYNIACYDCQLGEIESAKERLKEAFKLQPKYRALALDDSDLEPLWAEMNKCPV